MTAMLTVMVIGGTLPAGAADTATPRPPAVGETGIEDAWLGETCLDELSRATSAEQYKKTNQIAQTAILARLQCGRLDQFEALVDLAYVVKACTLLPAAEKITESKTVSTWMREHRAISRRLFRSLSAGGSAKNVFERLGELIEAEEAKVIEYPELAVAFATAEPLAHYRAQPIAASVADAFRWYTNGQMRFRHDLKAMPYELSRFLAYTRLSIQERQWAVKRYGKSPDPARSFYDVKIGRALGGGGERRLKNQLYTLPNIQQLGGTAVERAYYSAEVCKALGIPASLVYGQAKGGVGFVWLAHLRPAAPGKSAVWDSRTGRRKKDEVYVGKLRSPDTRKEMADTELALLAAAAQLPLADREAADAAVLLAGLVDKAREKTEAVDLGILKQLAKGYDQRLAGDADRPKANTDWIVQRRKLDATLVVELLNVAVARNLADGTAWDLIAKLAKDGRLPPADVLKLLGVLVEKAASSCPDYTCSVLLRVAATLPEAAQREKLFREATDLYRRRADLVGKVLIAMGDDYATHDRKDLALRTYDRAAVTCIDVAEVVLPAATRAEGLLTNANRRDLVIKMYQRLFERARMPRVRPRNGTIRYKLGSRLVQLLRDAGQRSAAERMQKRL